MGTKSLSSGHNCERSEAFGCCSSRHPQKHLLNFQGTGMPLGEAGHKGVLPVLLPPRLILQGKSPSRVVLSPSPGQEADRREFSVYNDFLENFLSRQAAPAHT